VNVAADRHHFADRLHRGRQHGLGALELLEREARDLGDDVIDRRLERGRGRAGDVVDDLVERVADRQLRRDLGDREAGRLRRQRRRARHARVHLDDDEPSILRIDRELDIGTACFDADFAQASDARVAHDLIFLVGQRQRRGDGNRVAGVHPHRVDILDSADDNAIVVAVAHDLHLIFLPAEQRLLDQHFAGRRSVEPLAHDLEEFLAVVGHPAPGPAERERRPDDRRQPGLLQPGERLGFRMRDRRAGAFEPDPGHRVLEFEPVLGLVDRRGIGADHLHAELLQRAVVEQRQRGVERGLPAHRREQSHCVLGSGRCFLLDDLGDDGGRDRLDIGRIRQLGIGHDRRRVRIDQDDAVPLLLERLDRLRARIIELARLPDDDGPGADDEDRGDVGASGHGVQATFNVVYAVSAGDVSPWTGPILVVTKHQVPRRRK
jgi:hypothetical protein